MTGLALRMSLLKAVIDGESVRFYRGWRPRYVASFSVPGTTFDKVLVPNPYGQAAGLRVSAPDGRALTLFVLDEGHKLYARTLREPANSAVIAEIQALTLGASAVPESSRPPQGHGETGSDSPIGSA